MADFVRVEVTTNPSQLADDAIARLQARWPEWTPNDGDLEVVQIETLAPMAADAAETASRVPAAVFREYGTTINGVPYESGQPAVTTVTITLTDTDGHTIPGGSEFELDGYAFTVDVDQIVAPGDDTATGVNVSSTTLTSAANDLAGSVTTPITMPAWVEDIVVDTPTSGGADPEDDVAYQDRLSRDLQLQAKTLVTTRDYELMALDDAAVGRVIALADSTRHVTVVVTGLDGEPVSTAVKDRLVELYAKYRLVNTIVTVADATYTTVNVTYSVKPYSGYDAVDLVARIDARLAEWLSPTEWGLPQSGDPGTALSAYTDAVVRRNKLIDIIADVEGVDYVDTLTITGSAGTVDGNGNLTMPGSIALPHPGTFTGTVL